MMSLKPPLERVVAESENPEQRSLSSPSILRLPSGKLLVSFDEFSTDRTPPQVGRTLVSVSEDDGASWRIAASFPIVQARLFADDRCVYLFGHRGDLCISRSEDGEKWSDPVPLTSGQHWHQSATNVWHTNDGVYLVSERRIAHCGDTWVVPWLAPVLLKGRRNEDLTDRRNWSFATELVFAEAVPGVKQNQTIGDYFGVPFFSQQYPVRAHVGGGRFMHPLGWLEGNVTQILDERHVWHDPSKRTFHLLLRCNTGGVGLGALAKVVEGTDGSLTTLLESVPSGRKCLFVPLPGGHLRFYLLYDAHDRLYWLIGNQSTDSMCRIECVPPERYNLPNNERNRLVIHFSRNLVDWCFGGTIHSSKDERITRCYPSGVIDGEDLLVVARGADARSPSPRESNLITFYRVKDFRRLAY